MKFRLVVVALVGLAMASWGWADEKPRLRVSYYEMEPYVIVHKGTGEIGGAAVEFMRDVGREMGYEVVFDSRPSTMNRQFERLESGRTDACLIFVKTPEREKFCYYPREDFHFDASHLVVRKDSPIERFESVEQLVGLKIGYLDGAFRIPLMQDERLTFEYLSSSNSKMQNLRKLMSGRIDAVYSPDSASVLAVARTLGVDSGIRLVRLPGSSSFYQVFSKKSDPTLVEKYNRAVEKLGGKEHFLKCLASYIDVKLYRESMGADPTASLETKAAEPPVEAPKGQNGQTEAPPVERPRVRRPLDLPASYRRN